MMALAERPLPQPAPTNPQTVHTLHPGDVVCAGRGDVMETLLGSCIAVILTDPRRTLGAMCHIVHAGPAMSQAADSAAYAGTALLTMYRLLLSRGIVPRFCDAYVFGGGNMFSSLYADAHVGANNARTVLRALQQDGIRVIDHDVGGTAYRRVRWAVGRCDPIVTAVEV